MTELIDKSLFKDSKGRYLVQGLFLEDRYDMDMAVFTFDGEDKLYKGKTFISLKKRYLDWSDPTEYQFASDWLYDWQHWQRLCNNKVVERHINIWREELTTKLRGEGINSIINLAVNQDSYQAAKYLAECGWEDKKRGRPSKEEIEGEVAKRAEERENWNADVKLLEAFKKGKK